MPAPYDTKAVANYILDLADAAGKQVSSMKLQKLVYFAHGWHLAITGDPLIDEAVEAWKFGPVISSLYHEFKEFGNTPITGRVTKVEQAVDKPHFRFVTPELGDVLAVSKNVIDRVWEVYSPFGAIQLSEMTHQRDTPWYQVWTEMGGMPIKGKDIPNELIREYFIKQKAA